VTALGSVSFLQPAPARVRFDEVQDAPVRAYGNVVVAADERRDESTVDADDEVADATRATRTARALDAQSGTAVAVGRVGLVIDGVVVEAQGILGVSVAVLPAPDGRMETVGVGAVRRAMDARVAGQDFRDARVLECPRACGPDPRPSGAVAREER